jgi:hypothetical protein
MSGFCPECKVIVTDGTAFVMTGDFEDIRQTNKRNRPKKVLYPNRDEIPIPDDIIDSAQKISDSFKIRSNRDEKLTRRRFTCLYYAFLEAKSDDQDRDIVINPESIAKMVKMNTRDISRALTEFSQFNTGYIPSVNTDTVFKRKPCVEIAIDHAKRLGLPADSHNVIEELINIAFEKKKEGLHQRTAQTVAAGAIKALYIIHNIKQENGNDRFLGVSRSTAENVAAIFIEAYNS